MCCCCFEQPMLCHSQTTLLYYKAGGDAGACIQVLCNDSRIQARMHELLIQHDLSIPAVG
jgi:hypothetical protein